MVINKINSILCKCCKIKEPKVLKTFNKAKDKIMKELNIMKIIRDLRYQKVLDEI
jgi:hypothetical protein